MNRKAEFERLHYEWKEAKRKREYEERKAKVVEQIYNKIASMNEYELGHWLSERIYFDEDYCVDEWKIYIDDEVNIDDSKI